MPRPQTEPVVSPTTLRGGDGLMDRMSPTGMGGNMHLYNQNEMWITKRTVESVPATYPPAMYDEPGRHA